MKKLVLALVFHCISVAAHSQSSTDTVKTVGKVSHKFKKAGCATVIILQSDPKVILIPRENLPKSFDKNGLKISFHYRRLRIPNPLGCVKGVPADITNVARQK